MQHSRANRQSALLQGRIAILKVHSRGKVLSKDVDFDKVARRTPGFTGADLQNLMNEAAIMAARRNLKEISKEEIADALERIVAGTFVTPLNIATACCTFRLLLHCFSSICVPPFPIPLS